MVQYSIVWLCIVIFNTVGYLVANDDTPINQVDCCKDLGLKFDDNASFHTHIDEKVAKARQLCNYILRTFRTRSAYPLISVYKSIVLPILEYCCVVWNPNKLQGVFFIECGL